MSDFRYRFTFPGLLGLPVQPLAPEDIKQKAARIQSALHSLANTPPRELARQAGENLAVGFRGATDAATFGLGNRKAALDVALYAGGSGTVAQRHQAVRAQQKLQDQYDRTYHPKARMAGEAVGTAASILATGGLGEAPQAVRLAPQVARMVKPALSVAIRPDLAAATAGAGSSLLGQATSDILSWRLSPPSDYVSAAAGGAAGGLATFRTGPTAAALAEAGVSGGVKSALTGQPLSFEDVWRNAQAGVLLGRLGHVAGTGWVDNLPSGFGRRRGAKGWDKGKLGERLSIAKTQLYGDKLRDAQAYHRVPGGFTRADHDTWNNLIVEAKMGRRAELSERQKAAAQFYGRQYQVDHWLPEDIGNALGGLLGLTGGQLSEDDRGW